MSILSRFGEIVSANINALLDKAEDPEKMIDQYLRKATEELGQVKKETAGVMAEEQRCKRLLDEAKENVAKYDGLARKALAAGNEGDARVFLAKKQEYEQAQAAAQKNYDVAAENASKMRQMHDSLVEQINECKARQQGIKATMAVARTQDRVTKAKSAFDGADGALAGFSRMEEKAQQLLDASTARAALDAEPQDPAASLESKYEGGGAASVDDALAAMKAEMGLS